MSGTLSHRNADIANGGPQNDYETLQRQSKTEWNTLRNTKKALLRVRLVCRVLQSCVRRKEEVTYRTTNTGKE